MLRTSNSIPENVREQIANLLNPLLSDATNLYLRAKQAHWNVKGQRFIMLHELFDDISSHALSAEDTLAERIVQLGGSANGTLESAVKNTTLSPYPIGVTAEDYHVELIVSSLASVGSNLRSAIDKALQLNDQITANILMDICTQVDKDLWFVESHTF